MVPLSRMFRYSSRAPEVLSAWRRTPAWREILLRYLEVGERTYPFAVPLRGGGVLNTQSVEEIQVFWHVFVRGCYDVPDDCRTIVDAGANVGAFAVWAARRAPRARVISLEPSFDTFERLQDNIRLNGLEERVTALNVGLAGATGERRMLASCESPRRSVVLSGAPAAAEPTIAIQCVTLAELLCDEGLTEVDLLKMDIEGSEWEVLLSTPPEVLAAIRNIRLEYHEVHASFGYTPEALFAHLAKAGHHLTSREEDTHRTGIACFERA